MEPGTIAAACVSILAGLTALLKNITTFILETRTSRRDMDTISKELVSLKICLATLENDDDNRRLKLPPTLEKQVYDVLVNIDLVTQRMRQLLKLDSGRFRRRVQWAVTERDEMNSLRLSLECNKTCLETILTIGSITMLTEQKRSLLSQEDETGRLVSRTEAISLARASVDQNVSLVRSELEELRTHIALLTAPGTSRQSMQVFVAESLAYKRSALDAYNSVSTELPGIHEESEQQFAQSSGTTSKNLLTFDGADLNCRASAHDEYNIPTPSAYSEAISTNDTRLQQQQTHIGWLADQLNMKQTEVESIFKEIPCLKPTSQDTSAQLHNENDQCQLLRRLLQSRICATPRESHSSTWSHSQDTDLFAQHPTPELAQYRAQDSSLTNNSDSSSRVDASGKEVVPHSGVEIDYTDAYPFIEFHVESLDLKSGIRTLEPSSGTVYSQESAASLGRSFAWSKDDMKLQLAQMYVKQATSRKDHTWKTIGHLKQYVLDCGDRTRLHHLFKPGTIALHLGSSKMLSDDTVISEKELKEGESIWLMLLPLQYSTKSVAENLNKHPPAKVSFDDRDKLKSSFHLYENTLLSRATVALPILRLTVYGAPQSDTWRRDQNSLVAGLGSTLSFESGNKQPLATFSLGFRGPGIIVSHIAFVSEIFIHDTMDQLHDPVLPRTFRDMKKQSSRDIACNRYRPGQFLLSFDQAVTISDIKESLLNRFTWCENLQKFEDNKIKWKTPRHPCYSCRKDGLDHYSTRPSFARSGTRSSPVALPDPPETSPYFLQNNSQRLDDALRISQLCLQAGQSLWLMAAPSTRCLLYFNEKINSIMSSSRVVIDDPALRWPSTSPKTEKMRLSTSPAKSATTTSGLRKAPHKSSQLRLLSRILDNVDKH